MTSCKVARTIAYIEVCAAILDHYSRGVSKHHPTSIRGGWVMLTLGMKVMFSYLYRKRLMVFFGVFSKGSSINSTLVILL